MRSLPRDVRIERTSTFWHFVTVVRVAIYLTVHVL